MLLLENIQRLGRGTEGAAQVGHLIPYEWEIGYHSGCLEYFRVDP